MLVERAHLMQIVRVHACPLFSLFRVNRIFKGAIWLANVPHVIEKTFLLLVFRLFLVVDIDLLMFYVN